MNEALKPQAGMQVTLFGGEYVIIRMINSRDFDELQVLGPGLLSFAPGNHSVGDILNKGKIWTPQEILKAYDQNPDSKYFRASLIENTPYLQVENENKQ